MNAVTVGSFSSEENPAGICELFRGLYKPASTFRYCTCDIFYFIHVLLAVLLVSLSSNIISIILADSYFGPFWPKVIQTAGPLGGWSPSLQSLIHPSLFHRPPAIPLSLPLPQDLSTPHWYLAWVRLDFSGASRLPSPTPHPQLVHMGLLILIWWHAWAQDVLEGVLQFGGVCTCRLITCSLIFVCCSSFPLRFSYSFAGFGSTPIILLIPSVSTRENTVWRASLSKTGINSNQHSLKSSWSISRPKRCL